jgi:homoserine kinase
MRKIKIRLPASVTNLGPGLNALGLALGLYVTVEVSPRADDVLSVEPQGEGAGRYPVGLRHPVVLALARIFQRLERAPLGITVRVDNQIPVSSGLGAETAFLAAGAIAGNNLLGSPFKRDELLHIAAGISRADSAVTAILGGLTTSLMEGDDLIYRTLPVSSQRVAVVLPDLSRYPRPAALERVPTTAALHNLARLPLLIEAFRAGDLALLKKALPDAIQTPRLIPQITGYAEAVEAATAVGAAAVTVAGDGPALLAFAERNHAQVAADMGAAFKNAGVSARVWVVPIDTQGLVLSVVGS